MRLVDDDNEAQEVAQDAFPARLARPTGFKGDAQFFTWEAPTGRASCPTSSRPCAARTPGVMISDDLGAPCVAGR